MKSSLMCVALAVALLSACGSDADPGTPTASGTSATMGTATPSAGPAAPATIDGRKQAVKACAVFEDMPAEEVRTMEGVAKIFREATTSSVEPVYRASSNLLMAAERERNKIGKADWNALIKDMRTACAKVD
jgi:hypothetical protein